MKHISLPIHEYAAYVCPVCKGVLNEQPQAGASASLCCPKCSQSYPVADHIPDFLAPFMTQIKEPLIQRVDQGDRKFLKTAASLYEGRLWYRLVIRMYLGANATSLADLTERVKSAVNIEQGRVLDAACGTATYGRRVASPGRAVYGIDISMAMLRQGLEKVQREQIPNVHLARTRVETLPFPGAFFDFGIASGSLHMFPDPLRALKEISRTLKPGARLVGLTFSTGRQGLVQYAWFRDYLKKRGTVHLFEPDELENDFHQAGFDHVHLQKLGSGIFFQVEKCWSR